MSDTLLFYTKKLSYLDKKVLKACLLLPLE